MKPEIIERLQLGRVPRVVGTIITSDFLARTALDSAPLPCDLVEVRLDGFADDPQWLQNCRQLQQRVPVFLTLRLAAEGGHWSRPDTERRSILLQGLEHLSGIDVELASPLAEILGRRAAELGRICVISHHNFHQTPPLEELHAIIARAQAIGSIAKVAARANSPEDVQNLRSLLHRSSSTPICVIGMGDLGRETRLSFPREGSCFTYGYLDTPGAPGQFSAAELTARLR